MNRTRSVDISLVAVSTFCAVAMVAAASMGVTSETPRQHVASAPTAPAPISWDQAQETLRPAVPARAAAALADALGTKPANAPDIDARPPTVTKAPVSTATGPKPGADCAPPPEHTDGHDHSATCAPSGGVRSSGQPTAANRETSTVLEPDVTDQYSQWRISYENAEYAEEGCGIAVFGNVVLPEIDPTKQCTMTKGAAFTESDPTAPPAGHGHHGDCRVTGAQYDGAFDLAERTRTVVGARYDNQPWNALADQYVPFPVPGTKTFHMFRSANYGDRNPDGTQTIMDPSRPEMFSYGMTDEGLMVVNVVYAYTGTAEELPEDKRADWHHMLPQPYGCMLGWHAHVGTTEGTATGNIDGRAFMTHVWTYPRTGQAWPYSSRRTFNGPYPFGEYLDGTEPHAWFTPFHYIPVLCNANRGCI